MVSAQRTFDTIQNLEKRYIKGNKEQRERERERERERQRERERERKGGLGELNRK